MERSAETTGYAHPAYAASLAEFGGLRLLPASGGWVLERPVPGCDARDAIGCYPLFACSDWSQLHADLDDIGNEFVSLALVTDPFGNYDEPYLTSCFRDVVMPFKEHFVVDLSRPIETFVSAHHRRSARKALREVHVVECVDPTEFLDDWLALYQHLIKKHYITGIAAFSRSSFAQQLKVPGIVVFRAIRDGVTVGIVLWYAQGDVVYYHLGAFSDRGYELRTSFALFNYSIEYFSASRFGWLDLGSGPGVQTNAKSGLSRFKQGWSTGTRTAYFCGRVFDQKKYAEIVKTGDIRPEKYFPAYRFGEFR